MKEIPKNHPYSIWNIFNKLAPNTYLAIVDKVADFHDAFPYFHAVSPTFQSKNGTTLFHLEISRPSREHSYALHRIIQKQQDDGVWEYDKRLLTMIFAGNYHFDSYNPSDFSEADFEILELTFDEALKAAQNIINFAYESGFTEAPNQQQAKAKHSWGIGAPKARDIKFQI